MKYDIIPTPGFEKSFKALAKRHKSLKTDFVKFVSYLEDNPFQGDELCPGVRKIRMAITSKGRGKSGGARVITYTTIVSEESGEVYLIEIYDKSDFSTVDVEIIKEQLNKLKL